MSFDSLKISTGWINIEIISEPTVVLTFKGYAPVVQVRVLQTKLDYYMYISAKSIAEGIEPLRKKNNGNFTKLRFSIRKAGEDKFAAYEIKEITTQ